MFGIFGKKGTGKIQLGTRVVRGPHWNHKSEDNGEGFLGTIVALCHSDRTIQVIWDTGRGGKYRADPNQYDLRLFDNAPTDQLHQNTTCFSCRECPIYGMKWTCTKCNINLCTQCYMDDNHDVEHIFERTITSESRRFKVRSRKESTEKIAAKGIFVGAEVVGGPYLNRNDDHNNDVGYVEQITNWKNKYQRGIVKVFWKNTEIENIHRLGAEGCVDIVCSRLTENATWGNYYPDHLPVIDFDYMCSNIPVSAFSGADDQNGEQNETNVRRILPSELSLHLKIDANEGDIWKGEWIQKTVKPVRIKLFKPGSYKEVIKEASIIKLCSHERLIKIYGVTPTFDWIVMEWFSLWNLLTYLRLDNEKEHMIHLKEIINIATQIASGMAYLETKRIILRSLKAANILINSFHTVKITGFGYAIILAADTSEYTDDKKEEFPVRWLSKEAFKYTYNLKSDVWSYGILLFELISLGDVPYCDMSDAEVVDFVNSGEMMAKPDVGIPCSDLYYARMSQCMNGNASIRPTFVDLYHCFDGYFDMQMKYENIDTVSRAELKINTKFSGEFQIWIGTWLKQQSKLVRIYGPSESTTSFYIDILREAEILQLCDHINIIQLYGITPTVDLMVTEFFSDNDLKTFLQQSKKGKEEEKVDLAKLVHIASQVACGMDYLGTKRIVHRDLRADNVLINDKHETKICGFHYARYIEKDKEEYISSNKEQFPIRWTALEGAYFQRYTSKSDVWSFGILLVELVTFGKLPYQGLQNRDCLMKLYQGFRHEKPYNCPENVYKIMLSCWNKEPENRFTFEYLFNYFDDYVVSAELEREEIDKYLRSSKNNGDQIQIQCGKGEEQESCEEEDYYTEASGLDVHNVDITLPPRIPILGITKKKSSTNEQHVYENVDVSSNSVEDTNLKLGRVDTAGDLAVYKSEQESSEEEGDHKDASGVDVHSDASDVDKNSQFALPPRIPTLGMNTKRSSTNKQHVYENVDVCSNNLEDTKLRLQQVDTADTITKCDDIPVYLSEEEEEDRQ